MDEVDRRTSAIIQITQQNPDGAPEATREKDEAGE